MDESPVINDSAEFVPMDETADAVSKGQPEAVPEQTAGKVPGEPEAPPPADDDGDEFTPMAPPTARVSRMPTPEQVLHHSDEDRRLDTVPFEFADIRQLAQRILKRAQEQGQAKIDAARKQVEAMEKQAYDKAYKEAFAKGQQDGFAKGEKEGRAEAEAKIAAAANAERESLRKNAAPVSGVLQQLTTAINDSRAQLMAQAEGDLLLLAIDLAKRLVGHELSVDPEAIKPLAIECVGLVTERTGITARVNPEDYRLMEEFYPELKQIFPDLGPVKVVPDAEVERGGLHAATREAEVDMRLATRLAAFEEVILGFSGEDAVAPWSRIPPEAIAAAREAQTESSYSLPPADEESEEQAAIETEPAAEEANDTIEREAIPESTPEQEPASEIPQEETATAQDLSDLAELADLAEEQPGESGQ